MLGRSGTFHLAAEVLKLTVAALAVLLALPLVLLVSMPLLANLFVGVGVAIPLPAVYVSRPWALWMLLVSPVLALAVSAFLLSKLLRKRVKTHTPQA